MEINRGKLSELAKSLSDDQRQLLREGLAGGGDLDPETLAASLRSFDSASMFETLRADTSPLDATPLTFKKKKWDTVRSASDGPVIVRLDHPPATLAEATRIAEERTGKSLTSVSEIQMLDLDPAEADEAPTLRKLAARELTGKAAAGRRMVRVRQPALTTTFDDLGQLQVDTSGTVAAARRVVVVVIVGPIIIIIIFTPEPPRPPPEPPLTRW